MSNVTESLNIGGGGNPLNIIRIPSINEVKNIIVSSDLNGSITPGNRDTWQYYLWDVMIYQNNKNELTYMANNWVNSFYDKSETFIRNEGPTSFHLVIEFRE